MTASPRAIRLCVPELGFGPGEVSLSLWLVAEGSAVLAGDRVVELVAGAATVDLTAPVSGRLSRCLAEEDELLATGQPIAEFAEGEPGAADGPGATGDGTGPQ
jgi:pyruvate/2-oxoglutarate dehydrogenase complex dihydrolipoamide acyltransferase (E2) component